MCAFLFSININLVPRKVLKEQFDERVEPDEPQQIDMDQNQDDLYDEDQFYRESEAIPPAPKLHRELATSDMPTSLGEPSSSVNPPLRSRDSNQLEGESNILYNKILCFNTNKYEGHTVAFVETLSKSGIKLLLIRTYKYA